MAETVIRVRGYTEVVKGLGAVDKATRKAVRADLRHIGDDVKEGSQARLTAYAATHHTTPGARASYARTASRIRTIVRQRGVSVEQTLRKTTGLHKEFGALQMRDALVPSLEANEEKTKVAVTESLDRICGEFNAL